jgi:hypothetical protein
MMKNKVFMDHGQLTKKEISGGDLAVWTTSAAAAGG